MKKEDKQTGRFNLSEKIFKRFFPDDDFGKKLKQPINFVVWIPRFFCGILLLALLGGWWHVYSNRNEIFNENMLDNERIIVGKKVSHEGKLEISQKHKFVKSIWTRSESPDKKGLLVWDSLPGLRKGIKQDPELPEDKDIETLSCDKKKVPENSADRDKDGWTDDKIRKVNAWCSLIGFTSEALSSERKREYLRRIVNKNDAIPLKDKNNNIEYNSKKEPIYKFQDAGNKELFAFPSYDPDGIGLNGFHPDEKEAERKISENGEYTLSIYPSVQEGMSEFMRNNNMIGSVFAYRPSNGDIYCMASTPGWTGWSELGENNKLPNKGSERNKNFSSFTSGSTMKPITLLLLKIQGKNLKEPTQVPKDNDKHRDKKWDHNSNRDSYFVNEDMKEDGSGPKEGKYIKAIHCTGDHSTANGSYEKQSAVDGLGNSCNSYFAMRAEELDLEKAKETLEAMDFYVEEYVNPEEGPAETKSDSLKHPGIIDKILYTKNALPLNKTKVTLRETPLNYNNALNFIGEGNLLVSPIDMAVLTALFGKLSLISSDEEKKKAKKNSKVYFPRLWLPACDETPEECKKDEGSPECKEKRNEDLRICKENEDSPECKEKRNEKFRKCGDEQRKAFPELLLTEKNFTKNEHIAKLSKFVSEHKNDIADVGEIWKYAFKNYYRNENIKWPLHKHLDSGSPFSDWSQWIDMAKTGTVGQLSDDSNPNHGKCTKRNRKTDECEDRDWAKNRTQRNLSFYSEELDLAAYIVIENYSGMYSGQENQNANNNSKTKLDSTSLVLMNLVADALGKELDSVKKGKEKDQIKRLKRHYNTKGINLKLIDEVNREDNSRRR